MLIAEMEERKPEIFARQLMRSNYDLPCLKASQPVMMSQCMGSDGAVLPPAIDVAMYQNEYSVERLTPELKQKLKGIVDSSSTLSFIDFTNPEDLFDFSGSNKDNSLNTSSRHPVVRLAKAMPTGFMKQMFDQYRVPPKSSPLPSVMPCDENTTSGASASAAVLSSITGGDGGYSHYTCHECKQQFSALHLFQRHFLTHPDPEHKKFLCQVCGKRFSRADHLNRHAQLHTEVTVHKCILCGEEFARASHLDKHRRRTHTANAPANMTPKSISNNNLHLLAAVASPDSFQPQQVSHTQHAGPSTSASVTVQSNDQIAGDNNTLQIAIGNVEGANEVECQTEPDRPFPCSVCGRKFIRATHLRRHMRIHTGEKPFFCHICGRRYARGDYLRAHIHAHRREKFHKCRVCGEVYHDLARFSNHCLSHNESEFLEASLRENKRRAENKLTQKLSSSKRVDVVPQTAGPAAPAVAMPAQAEYSTVMSQDSISGEICVSPIENPMHFVENHECTISSSVNDLQYQIVSSGSAEHQIMPVQLSASDISNHHPQQPHTVVSEVNNTVPDTASNTIQLHMTPTNLQEQSVISFPAQVSRQIPAMSQHHQIITLPTPQITPTQSPEFGQITLSHFQDSDMPGSSHPPPLQRAVVSEDTEILQHYSLVKSFNNEVMLIAPPASLTTNTNYNNHVSTTTMTGNRPYFPTPSASPMVYQGMSISELESDVLNHS